MLNIKVLTLFPELFPGTLGVSVIGEALKKGLWNLEVYNIRDYADNKHNKVDDEPYGGGSGMVFMPDVLANAIEAVTDGKPENYEILYPSPRGPLLKQKKIVEFANKTSMLLVCGRFEGIDQRIIESYGITEFSVGDYVLSGGEVAAQILIDATVRTLPGVLGNSFSLSEESFAVDSKFENLLEYPLYTRPALWDGRQVPEVLRSGNHQAIEDWRLQMSEKITAERRPDLWQKYKENKGN